MRRRSRFARYHEKNPTTDTYIIAGLGVALATALGYLLYTQGQANAVASSSSDGGGGSSTAGGAENVPGLFTGSQGPIGSSASGEGTAPFSTQTAPGPVGPVIGPLPIGVSPS